ncbi:MAG: hypothetical protein KA801_04380 [Syntrophorhabdaceae bacterium]|nr:hypothetical protein [Syntrophorhabdaceae bacterium]
MATDTLVWVFLGIVQIATAVYGGIASTKKNSKDKTKKIMIFAGLGVLGIALILVSGVRTYDAQKANEKVQADLRQQVQATNDKLSQSLISQEYMKGQLNSIGTVMSKIGEKSPDPVIGQMANTISKLAGNTTASSKEKEESSFYSSGNLTTAKLIRSGKGVIGDLVIKTDGIHDCGLICYDDISKVDDPKAIICDLTCQADNKTCFAKITRSFNKGLYCIPGQSKNCIYNISVSSR